MAVVPLNPASASTSGPPSFFASPGAPAGAAGAAAGPLPVSFFHATPGPSRPPTSKLTLSLLALGAATTISASPVSLTVKVLPSLDNLTVAPSPTLTGTP